MLDEKYRQPNENNRHVVLSTSIKSFNAIKRGLITFSLSFIIVIVIITEVVLFVLLLLLLLLLKLFSISH